MPFKVTVTNTDATDPKSDTFVFHQERIVIGRDSANDLPLVDLKRVVSKRHTEIVEANGGFQVTDLGSKNFTYLNGERLQSGQPYPCQFGDTVRIGDFELTLLSLDVAPSASVPMSADFDRTVFDVSFINPFQDAVAALIEQLKTIAVTFDHEAPNRRADALKEALQDAFEHQPHHATYAEIGRALLPEAEASTVAPPVTPPVAPPVVTPPVAPPPVAPPPVTPPQSADTAMRPAVAPSPRFENVFNTVLRSVAKLVSIPWQFRHEFIGQTIIQSEETAFLLEGNAEALRSRLLNPSLTEEEVGERLQLLEEAANDVVLHQVAMLDGYKASVQKGAQRLLDQISPETLQESLYKEKALLKFIPLIGKLQVLKKLGAQLQELRGEDWAAGERRTYRPAFIKAYLARMTSRRSAPTANDGGA